MPCGLGPGWVGVALELWIPACPLDKLKLVSHVMPPSVVSVGAGDGHCFLQRVAMCQIMPCPSSPSCVLPCPLLNQVEEGEARASTPAVALSASVESVDKAPVVKAKATHVILSSLITSKREGKLAALSNSQLDALWRRPICGM